MSEEALIPTPITTQDVAHLLHVVDNMKYGVLIIIAVLLLIGLAAFLLLRWWMLKKDERDQIAKSQRNERLTDSLNRLAESHAALTSSHLATTNRFVEALGQLTSVTRKMDESVTVLQQRASGQMTRTVSLKLVRDRLLRSVFLDVASLIERSLTENRYEERKKFIADKMRTAIGTILADTRADLRRNLGGHRADVLEERPVEGPDRGGVPQPPQRPR